MTQKNIFYLLGAAVLLAGVYFLTVPGTEPTTRTSERRLFEGIDAQAVAGITLEQGVQTIKLELKDGSWQIPERNGYHADNSKIRALLLKIFDLSVSQRVPTDAKSLEKLAVSDEAVKQGFGHIVLSDAAGKPIAGLRLGEARKSKDKSPMGVLGGQFVRKDGEQDVYLLATPLTLNMSVTSWLDVNLINLLPGAVRSIMQSKSADNGQSVEFELVRTGESDTAGLPQFTLSDGVPEGKALQDSVVTQLRGGLENLRIADVQTADNQTAKAFVFDRSTSYRATTGSVYRLDTTEKDGKFFAKLSVVFDPALAEAVKKDYEAAVQAAPTPVPTSTPPSASSSSSPEPTPSPVPTPKPIPTPELSNEEEAKKLNAQFAPWVYELPAYSARKFRYSKTELIEPPAPPPAPAAAPEGMPGMPPEMPPGMIPGQ